MNNTCSQNQALATRIKTDHIAGVSKIVGDLMSDNGTIPLDRFVDANIMIIHSLPDKS